MWAREKEPNTETIKDLPKMNQVRVSPVSLPYWSLVCNEPVFLFVLSPTCSLTSLSFQFVSDVSLNCIRLVSDSYLICVWSVSNCLPAGAVH